MAYLEISAGQVDANSPLDSTLFGQVRDNQIYLKAEKLEIDGSISMTGNLDMATYGIDWDAGTGAEVAIDTNNRKIITGGADLDLEGGDGYFNDVFIAGQVTAQNLIVGDAHTQTVGTTTSAGTGTLTDNSADKLNFDYLTANTSLVRITGDSENSVFPVRTLTDSNNVDLHENTAGSTAKTSFSITSGKSYEIFKAPTNVLKIGEINFTVGETGAKTFTISNNQAGVRRRLIMVDVGNTVSGDSYSMTYGDAAYNDAVGSGAGGNSFFYIKTGSNDITITKTGTNGQGVFDIYLEEVRRVGAG